MLPREPIPNSTEEPCRETGGPDDSFKATLLKKDDLVTAPPGHAGEGKTAAPTGDADGTVPHAIVLTDTSAAAVAHEGGVPSVPGYEILGALGRGGMGVVYKARHVRLHRLVALKMVLGGQVSDTDLARFLSEAQAVAALQHPNIAQVHEIGEWRSSEAGPALPYMALEFVDGGTLARKLKDTSPTPREAAQIVETLARAAHHAHERGIIHRDLKPGNVLLTKEGLPKICDFGIAKHLNPRADGATPSAVTQTGQVFGTPSYMAPEQARGAIREIGPATDVYALGVILYELLTGLQPFEADSPIATIQRVLNDDPLPPSRWRPNVPRDLDTICMMCLEKQPEGRYLSAEALADDLRAFLAGDTIRARPPTAKERAVRWVQRRPTLAALTVVAAVAVGAALIGALVHSVLAFVGVAVLSLLLAAWWYNASLQSALRELAREHKAAQHNVERLHFLLETTRRLMAAPGVDQVLAILGEATTRLVNAERATIYVVDREKRELWSRVAMGDGVGEIRVLLGTGIAGSVAQSGESINLPDAYADPRFSPEVDRRTAYRTRNLLTVPVRADHGLIIGVFQVLNKRQGTFDNEDLQLLQALAPSAAAALGRGVETHRDGSTTAPPSEPNAT